MHTLLIEFSPRSPKEVLLFALQVKKQSPFEKQGKGAVCFINVQFMHGANYTPNKITVIVLP